ncbi:ABC transporter permease [Pseudobacteriovorax antillogorgiicola]|uniref:MacB-like core domain-containing protein n=1 Tax=Pseudobacteriovorax antillogorgiicola TaxID=1513793 RepID=A0A1Y6C577_9BACT|nr:ABC transporter permease [Pseudobacteriovorax antillogorgiicola]TCS51235.1 MacB-like protein [Pseudobacteriovorax antillogorgiicola]SMF36821.1 MacB-like core domain-containing protein [Pseudobacteriovorax antillogorgiicola]
MSLIFKRFRYYWAFYSFFVLSIAIAGALPLSAIRISSYFHKLLDLRLQQAQLMIAPEGSSLASIATNLLLLDRPPQSFDFAQVETLLDRLPKAVPVYITRLDRTLIIGTNQRYFQLFQLSPVRGRVFDKPGDIVLGSDLASSLKAKVGSKTSLGHRQGLPSHKLRVVGLLSPSMSPLDRVLLTDLETAYELEDNFQRPYTHLIHAADTTPKPLTSILIGGLSQKERSFLWEKLQDFDDIQVIQPDLFIDDFNRENQGFMNLSKWLMSTVLGLVIVSLAVIAYLVYRLRRYEFIKMRAIGFSKKDVGIFLAQELLLLAFLAGICCFLITWGVTSTTLHLMGFTL